MKQYTNDFVSIVMPNFNCSNYLDVSISSVLEQSYENFELLFIDDNSTDDSYFKACKYASIDERIKVFKNSENRGAAYCRNFAIRESKGRYICFLDSDDVWIQNKLEKQINFMKENNCDFSFTGYELIDDYGRTLNKIAKTVKKLTYSKYLYNCFTGCLTVCYDQVKIGLIQGPDIKNNNDYGLFLEVLKKTKKACGINDNLASYRVRANSISRNKLRKIKPFYELMHVYQKKSYLKATIYLVSNLLINKIWKYKKVIKTT